MSENRLPKIAVFISGGGTGLQAIIDAVASDKLKAELPLVVSSSKKAYGLVRAEEAGIEQFVFRLKRYDSPETAGADLLKRLEEKEIDFIALSGYLKLLPEAVVSAYSGKICNIHPALLPKYGGKGMYGRHVHEAVIAAGDKESGCTVHLVDEIYDNGRVLAQSKVPVMPDDTPETLAARVLKEEHSFYPKVLGKLINGELK